MDGVLVDFANEAIRRFGGRIARSDVTWDFPVKLGFSHGLDPEFLGGLDYGFWANLPWTAEGRALLAGLESIFGESVCLVSTPAEGSPGCRDGKADWVSANLPAYNTRTFLGRDKFLLAGPQKVLIDDHEPNVDAFMAHGGRAVLVPRPWNRRRRLTDADGNFDADSLLKEVASAARP